MKSIHKIETWTLKELPLGKKPINVKWVYNIKQTLDKKHKKVKVRLVTRGFKQWWGVNFEKTFTLVMKFHIVWSIEHSK